VATIFLDFYHLSVHIKRSK